MTEYLDRRDFLGRAFASGVTGLGLGAMVGLPSAIGQFVAQRMTWTAKDFTEGQQRSIKNIMQVVFDRFFARHVHANTFAVAKRWQQSNDYFAKTRLPNTNQQRWDLLYAQKLALNTGGVPVINFYPYNEVSDYWAYVDGNDAGCVVTEFGRNAQGQTTAKVTGQFEIHINTFRLGGVGGQSDSNVWAGVIAHEMLHCLGHLHGKDEYGDSLQINACQQAVRTNGTYKTGGARPAFRCGHS